MMADISNENVQLKKQVEMAKQQLIKLETANGKAQISIPGQAAVSTPPPAQEPQKQEKQAQQPKKEKPKKEKAPAGEKPAAEVEGPIDISRLDMRVGKIVAICKHPDADALYKEEIDCGEEKPRTIISGLVKFVPIEEMLNRMVIVLCNLKPAKMRGITSEGMVMCASTPEKVEVLAPPAGSVPGDLVHCEGFTRNPDVVMNPKKKIFETVAPDLKTNDQLIGCYQNKQLVVPGKGPIVTQSLKNVQIK